MKKLANSLLALLLTSSLFFSSVYAVDDTTDSVEEDPTPVTEEVVEEKEAEEVVEEVIVEEAPTLEPTTENTDEPTVDPVGEGEFVAKIGDTTYDTLDEAIKAAVAGDVITLGQAVTTGTMEIAEAKEIVITGESLIVSGHTTLYGSLTYKDITVTYTGSDITTGKGSLFKLDHANVTMDGAGTTYGPAGGAIYRCNGKDVIELDNESTLTIKDYSCNAITWDGGSGYAINILNGSSLVADHNRAGITGTHTVTVDKSTLNVVNSRGNGSNGSHFYLTDAEVVFSNNVSNGLSTGVLSAENSTVTCKNNGLNGIICNSTFTVKNSDITVTGTKGTSYWNAGIRPKVGGTVDADSSLTITDNFVSGIYLDANASLSIAEGAEVTITGNYAFQENCTTKKDKAQKGGAAFVNEGATLVLPENAKVYNNHALLAGDDIYSEGTVTVGTAQAVALDGKEGNCTHTINGWYDDSVDTRWAITELKDGTTCGNGTELHVEEKDGKTTYTGTTALKAAHDYFEVTYKWVVPEGAEDLRDAVSDLGIVKPITERYAEETDFTPATQEEPAAEYGYVFDGWYSNRECTENAPTSVNENTTVYGWWDLAQNYETGYLDLIVGVTENDEPVKMSGTYYFAIYAEATEWDLMEPSQPKQTNNKVAETFEYNGTKYLAEPVVLTDVEVAWDAETGLSWGETGSMEVALASRDGASRKYLVKETDSGFDPEASFDFEVGYVMEETEVTSEDTEAEPATLVVINNYINNNYVDTADASSNTRNVAFATGSFVVLAALIFLKKKSTNE